MPETGSPENSPGSSAPRLDELMLAMDVVDTLRHQDQLIERELGQGTRDQALKERLRRIYESQGLEVSERILDEGIRALKEQQFVYTPPAPGLATFLAGLWIRRRKVGAGVVALVLAGGLVLGWTTWRESATQGAQERQRIEMTERLPRQLRAAGDSALQAAAVEPARQRVAQLIADGEAGLRREDPGAAREAIAGLEELRRALVEEYEIRIVSREGVKTGTFRVPNVNESARNYYLIVEAIGGSGQPLTLPVLNEENGKTENVSIWGVRVPEATFEQVRRDKQDDGVVQNRVLGAKKRGQLDVSYRAGVTGGHITRW